MKRLIILAILSLAFSSAFAQKYGVVDSEKIFKSIEAYNTAMTELDTLAKSYQAKVNEMYSDIEVLYNAYITRKESMSASVRSSYEKDIAQKEAAAEKYQQGVFGQDGLMMKKRIELIQPIQKRVFAVIEKYATENEYDLILDKASNTNMLFSSKKVDCTEAIINMLK